MHFHNQSEQPDETTSSVVYIPQSEISQDLPPIIVIVQSEINEEAIATYISYCVSIAEKHKALPILFIIALKGYSSEVFKLNFERSETRVLEQTHLQILDEELLHSPMNELVAFDYFLINYRKLVLSSTSSKDSTVQWLVKIAKAKMKVRTSSLERAAS
ncbi:hypothetical protein DFQ30_009036 [Apophysomyces sp. BC1015]|nr:hypothetical protein DFQ30_009036 [Apophysomyces sp. BC1015]